MCVLCLYIYMYAYMPAIILSKKKRDLIWRRVRRGIWDALEAGKGEMLQLNYHLENFKYTSKSQEYSYPDGNINCIMSTDI